MLIQYLDFFKTNLRANPAAQEYLTGRGLSESTIEELEIG